MDFNKNDYVEPKGVNGKILITSFPGLDENSDIPGYGLFEFTAPADPSGTVTGDQVILISADGHEADSRDDGGGGVGGAIRGGG